jgi:hypothetical protein
MPETATNTKDKKTAATERAERSTETIDDVLNRLGEIIRNANQPQTGGNPAPRPSTGGGLPTPTTTPPLPVVNGEADKTNQLREWLGTEVMYLQMLPPVTPKTLMNMDGFVQGLPALLKGVKDSPFLKQQIRQAVAEAKARAESDGGRSTGDAELAAVVDKIGSDVSGASGERFVPILLAGMAGIALGRALYDITH